MWPGCRACGSDATRLPTRCVRGGGFKGDVRPGPAVAVAVGVTGGRRAASADAPGVLVVAAAAHVFVARRRRPARRPPAAPQAQVKLLAQTLAQYPNANYYAISVGYEVLLRGDASQDQLIGYIQQVGCGQQNGRRGPPQPAP